MGKVQKILSIIVPPVFFIIYRRFSNKNTDTKSEILNTSKEVWRGNFLKWEEALYLCDGYDNEKIVTKCFDSILQVKQGKAVYERDSVLFDKIEYSTGLLSALFLVSLAKKGRVSVLDFGGSFGTSYFQNIEFKHLFNSCQWGVVEQEHFIKLGKEFFEDDSLKFFWTIEECLISIQPNIILISSSLQYISNPLSILEKINQSGVQYILFDRIACSTSENFITIQNVPVEIYEASYPCWILNYDRA